MGPDEYTAITDPASVLIGLGALCGLVASWAWLRVGRALTAPHAGGKPRLDYLGTAAVITSIAIGLASLGYLLEHFSGRL